MNESLENGVNENPIKLSSCTLSHGDAARRLAAVVPRHLQPGTLRQQQRLGSTSRALPARPTRTAR